MPYTFFQELPKSKLKDKFLSKSKRVHLLKDLTWIKLMIDTVNGDFAILKSTVIDSFYSVTKFKHEMTAQGLPFEYLEDDTPMST